MTPAAARCTWCHSTSCRQVEMAFQLGGENEIVDGLLPGREAVPGGIGAGNVGHVAGDGRPCVDEDQVVRRHGPGAGFEMEHGRMGSGADDRVEGDVVGAVPVHSCFEFDSDAAFADARSDGVAGFRMAGRGRFGRPHHQLDFGGVLPAADPVQRRLKTRGELGVAFRVFDRPADDRNGAAAALFQPARQVGHVHAFDRLAAALPQSLVL